MHHISKIDEATAGTPEPYRQYSSGFRRAAYVDYAMGSVHMGVGICFLEPNGVIQTHIHSFEESFYILEGSVTAQVGDDSRSLGPGHFGLIRTGLRHAWRNTTNQTVRWIEMQAPQPRSAEYGRDTFFSGEESAQSVRPR